MRMYKQDCFKKRPIALTALSTHFFKLGKVNLTQPEGEEEGEKSSGPRSTGPGAGMEPEKIEPFARVLKDGFYEVDCIKDYMYAHGDAFGFNKHEYKLKDFSNVSIVHYKDIVPSEDQKAMSQETCFEFCRTVPDMLFFGLLAGRECYCMPYYKMMAGDSSACDAVCEGKPTTMCGGMLKSSVFEMHLCADTAEDLKSAVEGAEDLGSKMASVGADALQEAEDLQNAAAELQGTFGSAGDPVASDLMQEAKVFAGDFQHTAEDTVKLGEKLEELKGKAEGMQEGDFSDFETIKEAEATIKEIKETSTEGEESLEKPLDSFALCAGKEIEMDELEAEGEGKGKPEKEEPEGEGESKESTVLKQYVNIMLLVDKEYKDVPSTCGGDMIKKPLQVTAEDCAKACDSEGKVCVGFSFFDHFEDGSGVCFMFSKFKEVTYYTECGGPEDEKYDKKGEEELVQIHKPNNFFQVSKTNSTKVHHNKTHAKHLKKKGEPKDTVCYAKFHNFVGVSLKPDPSGKCSMCLKKANKAQRCFGSS